MPRVNEVGGETALIYRGAEADLLRGDWCGLPAVYKIRRPLPYRLKILDDMIRVQRTAHEAQMLHEAKNLRLRTPYVYFVDTTKAVIVMELVQGERLKEAISLLSQKTLERVFMEFGGQVARLHQSGIMHGDLTTSNVLLREGEVTFIDFGLALRTSRLEDHAVDLRLVKETLTGAHSSLARSAYESLLSGYEGEVGRGKLHHLTRQVAEIERRGRYARAD